MKTGKELVPRIMYIITYIAKYFESKENMGFPL